MNNPNEETGLHCDFGCTCKKCKEANKSVELKMHKISVLYKYLFNGNSVRMGQFTYRMAEDEQIGFVCWDEKGNEHDYVLSAHYPTIKELSDMVDSLGKDWYNICSSNVLQSLRGKDR